MPRTWSTRAWLLAALSVIATLALTVGALSTLIGDL